MEELKRYILFEVAKCFDSEISEVMWRLQRPKDWLYLGIEVAERALSLPYLLGE